MAMRLDIRVKIVGERQTNERGPHPVDSGGQGMTGSDLQLRDNVWCW